ncbi:hypothetical protein LTSEWAN_6364, partial [Salmonella enterica subsp. enterica serovar Wandsworth str. A4-580]
VLSAAIRQTAWYSSNDVVRNLTRGAFGYPLSSGKLREKVEQKIYNVLP